MSTLKVNTIDAHSGSTINIDSTADVSVDSATSATSSTTGALKVTGGISTQENLYVGGNAVITGTMTANGGTITLGDAGTDNVTIGGEINSDVIPDVTNTYDLGSASKGWAEVHATTVTGNLTGNVTGNVTGNADTATTLATARTLALSGDVSGSVSFDGSANATITATIADDSHNHTTANVDGLDTALGLKAPLASPALTGVPTAPTAAANTNTTQVATTAYVQTEVTDLIGGAPGTLDTLNELAAAINDDESYASTLTTALATKTAKTSNQSLSTAANAMTISGNTITLARGDSTTDTVTVPEYDSTDIDTAVSLNTAKETNVTTNLSTTTTSTTNTVVSSDGTNAVLPAATTSVAGMQTAADKTKLDGIEALADVTDVTNVTAAGALMDSEVTNLAAVKAFATTDYATAAQGTTADAALPKTGGAMTGAITTTSTFDGRDVATDGTKLDTIATSANNYSLPVSAPTVLGGVKEGGDIAIDASGVMTVNDDSHNHVVSNVDGLQAALDAKTTPGYVDTQITNLIGGAPGTLNTLNELAAAINDDAAYASTLTTALGTKVAKTSNQALSTAANAMTISGHTITLNRGDGTTDTVTVPDNNTTYSVGDGGLSQINFTSADHSKLNGIEAGATADQTGAQILALFSNSITAGHIAANAIGASELNSNIVNSEHYVDGSIDRVHLANDIIDGTKIANDVINSEHYAAGSIDNEHIADNAINSEHYADNSIDALHLNVSGNGTTSQYLRSDGDGTMSWVTPPNTNTTYSPGTGLDLSGTTFSIEADLREGGTGSDRYWGNTHDYIFADASHGLRFYTAGAEEMRLEDDGDLHVDGQVVAYSGTVSDERLKTGVSNVTGALDKVAQLNGVEFTYKKDGRRSAGVIAQDVEKVLPSAVTEKEMPFEEGSDKFKVVEYDALHALLIEAVKELRDEVNILKGEK